ncbi:hypothetical protein EB796_024047 [Bugula neritina]|uniref:LIM zinc-binding domain-containing protein n=1 Tax=Bugula neritina TaxID=10212 RepID=A0A7J7IUY1_BUGNE|nr:hypothetical protein EB796_024047 [Bugula neritina]
MSTTICTSCTGSLMGKRYVLRDDKATCLKCYETKFANKCQKCKTAIGTGCKDVTYKDEHYHENCFLCACCNKTLANTQFLTHGSSLICEKCYNSDYAETCDVCRLIFKHGMEKIEYSGRRFHTNCFVCLKCHKCIGQNTFMPMGDKFMCTNCYNDSHASKCGGCGKIISKSGIRFEGLLFHKECFVCRSCRTCLAGVKFAVRDAHPFCTECFAKKFCKKCELCLKPIAGLGSSTKFVTFEGKQWHSQCFRCFQCTKNISGEGFSIKNSKIVCARCV